MSSNNIFSDANTAIDTSAPPSNMDRITHPVSTSRMKQESKQLTGPFQTNKFYGNVTVGSGTDPLYPHPYVLYYNAAPYTSLGISYSTQSSRVFGPPGSSEPYQYFYSPSKVMALGLSSTELYASSNPDIQVDSLDMFSVNLNLYPNPANVNSKLWVPIVQGMGYVTGEYFNTTPKIVSQVGIRSFTSNGIFRTAINKYTITLNDNSVWAMYAFVQGNNITNWETNFVFDQTSGSIISQTTYTDKQVVIQLAYVPNGSSDALSIYDATAGTFPKSATLNAYVNGDSVNYSFNYTTLPEANSKVLQFALPHHQQTATSDTNSGKTGLSLETTTKGTAVAYYVNSFSFTETINKDLFFLPGTSPSSPSYSLSANDLSILSQFFSKEMVSDSDFLKYIDVGSIYFSGKAIDKYANLLIIAKLVLNDKSIVETLTRQLKAGFELWINNKQKTPLAYDTSYFGIVSKVSINSDNGGADFGNGYYNDHHFHYGYWIHAAACLGYVDPTWASDSSVRSWVNSLVRDVANPTTADTYFPLSRSFDWFHGHSWAKGLYASADGKDEESSSEDYHHLFGIALWGNVIGDSNMENRARLALAIAKRSIGQYMLFTSDNSIQPSQFIGNKVSGILFENKIDHTTYFGTNIEYIQGIHMIPLTAASCYVRSSEFAKEEWNTYFANGVAESLTSGWRGIILQNQALFDPASSYSYWSKVTNFSAAYLDDGASWANSFTYAAILKDLSSVKKCT